MSDRTKPARQKHSLNDKKTQWHMAITPAMKLEFMEYSQILDYVPERLLNTKALQIDLLIIKKNKDISIENEIGRIFQQHNIIEYKSPHDKEGINTYFQVHAYASLYKIGEKNTAYEPEDITITMIRRGKPYKLFQWFAEHECKVIEMYKGVYHIQNAGFFKTQVIVARELEEESHIWLTSLTDTLNRQQAENLIDKSKALSDKPEAGYVDAVLQIVSKANRRLFEEIKKEDQTMYKAFVELMQPEIDAAVNEAVVETTNNITAQNKVEAIENAIKKLNMTKEEACAFMDTSPEQYDVYKQIIIAANNKKQKGHSES